MKHFTALVKSENGNYSNIACLVKRSNAKKDCFGNNFYTFTAKVEYGSYTLGDVNNPVVSVNSECDAYVKNTVERLLKKWLEIPEITIECISETIF